MNRIIKILILLFLVSCQQKELDFERIVNIGNELKKNDFNETHTSQISDVVLVGYSLKEKLLELQKNATAFEFNVKEGDFEKPFGNNQADAILTIISN